MADQTKVRRDGLGHFCFYLHLFLVAFVVTGWAAPWRGMLIVYLIFLPAMVLHWKLNGGTCALNNLENWLRYRRWRAPERNPEEGAWLRTLIRSLTGIGLTRRAMDIIIHAAISFFWLLAVGHIQEIQGS